MANLNCIICVECTKQYANNKNCSKCVFCSRFLHKDSWVAEQTLPKNTASEKSEAVCMPCSTKFNINNLADVGVHDFIESSASSEPGNAVSNPAYEDFFDNCAYCDQKSLNNLAISKKGFFIIHFNIRNLQKKFDGLAHYLSVLIILSLFISASDYWT